jgi:predicted secreted protein
MTRFLFATLPRWAHAARLQCALWLMDLARIASGFGSSAYYAAVCFASDCQDWRDDARAMRKADRA